jgi:hypothetical protein
MNKETFCKIIATGSEIINDSENFHSKTKESMSKYSQDIIKRINDFSRNGKQNLTIINSFKKEYLTFWNESISKETEMFWWKLENGKIEVERKEPFKYALLKNRFQNVHQGMDANKNWHSIKEFGYINKRFTENQIIKLQEIIEKDEKERLDLLKKCFERKKIPNSKYLRFGDSVNYFNNCNLFKKYFKSEEVVELMKIWQDYK